MTDDDERVARGVDVPDQRLRAARLDEGDVEVLLARMIDVEVNDEITADACYWGGPASDENVRNSTSADDVSSGLSATKDYDGIIASVVCNDTACSP